MVSSPQGSTTPLLSSTPSRPSAATGTRATQPLPLLAVEVRPLALSLDQGSNGNLTNPDLHSNTLTDPFLYRPDLRLLILLVRLHGQKHNTTNCPSPISPAPENRPILSPRAYSRRLRGLNHTNGGQSRKTNLLRRAAACHCQPSGHGPCEHRPCSASWQSASS
jgi:hypothetical protein